MTWVGGCLRKSRFVTTAFASVKYGFVFNLKPHSRLDHAKSEKHDGKSRLVNGKLYKRRCSDSLKLAPQFNYLRRVTLPK